MTDAFSLLDQFDVFDFGVLVGSTPLANGAGFCGNDPVTCFNDPLVSSGSFFLAAGAHEITFVNTSGNTGAHYFNAQTAVPEPASLALLGIGLAGLGFARKKKGH